MFVETQDYIEGSTSELVARKVQVNGELLDNVGVSVLSRFGVIQNVGKADKVQGKKGKIGYVYRIPKHLVKFENHNV